MEGEEALIPAELAGAAEVVEEGEEAQKVAQRAALEEIRAAVRAEEQTAVAGAARENRAGRAIVRVAAPSGKHTAPV